MGIPHLTTYIAPYLCPHSLGCNDHTCQTHTREAPTRLIIDGPALAYHIYHTLLAHSDSTHCIDAVPTHSALGAAYVTYIDQLLRYNVVIPAILFDGALPPRKRPTRLARLESVLAQLCALRARGALPSSTIITTAAVPPRAPLLSETLFLPRAPLPSRARGIPPAPFLVPAILDALAASSHAGLVKVVDGEADGHCAAGVRSAGGVVLTGDSDLVLHAVGVGGVGFLREVEVRSSVVRGGEAGQGHRGEECTLSVLSMRVLWPGEVGQRLGLAVEGGWMRVGFEVAERVGTFYEAVRRAKAGAIGGLCGGKMDREKTERFEAFIEEFRAQEDKEDSAWAGLDPRVAEVATQCEDQGKVEQTVHVYLPFLIEDPARASAWKVAVAWRTLAYALLMHGIDHRGEGRRLLEYGRRGDRIVPAEVGVPGWEVCLGCAERFAQQLEAARQRLTCLPAMGFWRMFAMVVVYRWHIDIEQPFPPAQAVWNALFGVQGRPWNWMEVYISAQLDAVLYSLRILKQALAYLAKKPACTLEPHIATLAMELESLPPIGDMMRSRLELLADPKPDIKLEMLRGMAMGASESSRTHMAELDDTWIAADEISNCADEALKGGSQRSNAKKLRRTKNKSTGANARANTAPSTNMYSILSGLK